MGSRRGACISEFQRATRRQASASEAGASVVWLRPSERTRVAGPPPTPLAMMQKTRGKTPLAQTGQRAQLMRDVQVAVVRVAVLEIFQMVQGFFTVE